jgi:hypothetical protein
MRLALLLVPVLALAACGPSIDPAAKADIDRRFSAAPNMDETYPPSESYLPMAFAVGQWTQHRIRDEKGAQILTLKLVGQENDEYWIEAVTESYEGREVVKMNVAMLKGRSPSGMEIRSLRIKKGTAAAVDVEPSALPELRQRYRPSLDLLAVSFDSTLKDDARVPAGHFIGCYKTQSRRAWGPWQKPTVLCVHPSVPLSGVVRGEASGETQGLIELIGFGTNGAEPEL